MYCSYYYLTAIAAVRTSKKSPYSQNSHSADVRPLALLYLGRAGLYTLAAVMGVTDVDPFILSLAESASSLTPVTLAGGAIVIAAASNNLIKGAYAYGFGDRRTGTKGLALLTVLGLLGLLPLFL